MRDVYIVFEYGQHNKQSKAHGPYPFVQFTYDAVRVGENGDEEIATFVDGLWVTKDGAQWSDIIINTSAQT